MIRYPSTAKDAFSLLQKLAEMLEDPARRDEARKELEGLVLLADGRGEEDPLRLQELEITVGARRERLRLLLLPSIFAPEDWAYTFLEGLLRVPPEEYEGKRLVEVGTGSGWICIALARLTDLASIEGVDLNPQAAAVATCNLWLNCDAETAARVSFSQGDLLRGFPPESRWDFVVGCIPQVLRTEGLETELLEEADEAKLYDLSNYCALQNVYEDHFGLGLIAKLLDEAPERLLPGGRLLLNLAGRPGRAIIERMFTRRGFSTGVVVARRVKQASDTDIRPLVALEQATHSDFEFYMAQHSAEPIRAQTALGWLEAGNDIWHEVAVWEARLRHPHETLALRRGLREAGLERLLESVDLGEASQEQLGFVASLARRLAEKPFVPYALEAGDLSLREKIARYFARFFNLHLSEREIFIAPERQQAVYSLLLATCDPGDEILATRSIHREYERVFEKAKVRATVTNDTLEEVRRLLGAFDPKVVFLGIAPDERADLDRVFEIVDDAAERGIWVVVDESAYLNITSGIESRTLFERLAKERHRPNLVVLCGMIKNAVYPDYELTMLLPLPERLFADLEVAAELTYSRISTPVSWFYEDLFSELLRFQISFAAPQAPGRREFPQRALPRSRRIEEVAQAPAFAPKFFRDDDPRLIRLDYGENEDRVPFALLEGILGAALLPATQRPELAEAVAAFLTETRGVAFSPASMVFSQGVWPLIHDAVFALGEVLGRPPRIFAAAPCYGILPPTLRAAGAEVTTGPLTDLWEKEIEPPDAVVLAQPANPEGCFLDEGILRTLADYALENDCRIFSDEIFGLLALQRPKASTVPSPLTIEPRLIPKIAIFGGLSKEFAAGGMRMGFAAIPDPELREALIDACLAPLQRTTALAAAHVYGAWLRTTAGELAHPKRRAALDGYLESLRRSLSAKRDLVASAFGAAVKSCDAGGLFIAPDVSRWLDREFEGERLRPETFPKILYRHTGVVVNGGAWCSDPRRIRAVFSIPREKVEEAARRLTGFLERVE